MIKVIYRKNRLAAIIFYISIYIDGIDQFDFTRLKNKVKNS